MSASLHILRQTGKVPWLSVLDKQKKKEIANSYEHGVRGTSTCAQCGSTCKFLVLLLTTYTGPMRRGLAARP